MNIINAPSELNVAGKRVCLAIGFFDGVHLGHQQIIRQTIADARQHDGIPLVLTFDKHPNAIVAPEKTPPLIYSLPQKLRTIESMGIEHVLLIRFDKQFSQQRGEDFIRSLARDFGRIHSICVGADFAFGHKRSGNVALLKKLGGELHFQVHGLSAVSLDGQAVSSTRIREAIRAGNLDDASQMLARPYAICGNIVAGDKLGRTLGFPTANLNVAGLVLPPNGVYSAITRHDGRLYRVALNIGTRPTVAAGRQLRVEAHLTDFDGDLYGRELEIEIGEKLRDEKKFASPQQLKEQITKDITVIRGQA
ncbi:MAG TPA: bifunctional riboflavin kinase/FAD synthetase [Verrucomicrobiae bacterium]|nr:bifunctional riboflavin kinase/FAD synthetase [Verrucomicrobiae bacterium]